MVLKPGELRQLSSLIWLQGCGEAAVPSAVSIYSWPARLDSCYFRLRHPCTAPHQILLPSRPPREKLPSPASRAQASLTPAAPFKTQPLPPPGHGWAAFPHLQRKNSTPSDTTLTWLLSNCFFSGVGGNNALSTFTNTKTGHGAAETKMHPYPMFGPQFALPLLRKLCRSTAHSLPPNSSRAACRVRGDSFTDSVLQRPQHL